VNPGWVEVVVLALLLPCAGLDVVLDAVVLVVVERAGLLVLDVLAEFDELLLVLGLDDVLVPDDVRE